jgi:glutamate-1-semialdehyde 2,1-aminomutase
MALMPALSRRLSKWVKSYDYADEEFLRADGAGEPWIELRHKAIDRLAMSFQAQYAKSVAWGNDIRESLSDLRFTDANQVPFPFIALLTAFEAIDIRSVPHKNRLKAAGL